MLSQKKKLRSMRNLNTALGWATHGHSMGSRPDRAHFFYLPHMKYGKVLVSRREKWKKFIAYFHVLWLFIPKKHDLSDKFFSVCHAPLPLPVPVPLLDEICAARISAALSPTAYKFRLPLVIWAGLMHLILRILKFWNLLRKLRSQKILKFI